MNKAKPFSELVVHSLELSGVRREALNLERKLASRRLLGGDRQRNKQNRTMCSRGKSRGERRATYWLALRPDVTKICQHAIKMPVTPCRKALPHAVPVARQPYLKIDFATSNAMKKSCHEAQLSDTSMLLLGFWQSMEGDNW